jgi:hypothetical protein
MIWLLFNNDDERVNKGPRSIACAVLSGCPTLHLVAVFWREEPPPRLLR